MQQTCRGWERYCLHLATHAKAHSKHAEGGKGHRFPIGLHLALVYKLSCMDRLMQVMDASGTLEADDGSLNSAMQLVRGPSHKG